VGRPLLGAPPLLAPPLTDSLPPRLRAPRAPRAPRAASSSSQSFSLTAAGALQDLNSEAVKASFASKLVGYLESKGAGVAEDAVQVDLSAGSVKLQSSLSTGSALDKERMSDALNAMNTSEASAVFGLDVLQTEGVIVTTENEGVVVEQWIIIVVAAAGGVALILTMFAFFLCGRKGGTTPAKPKQFDVEKKGAKPKVVEVVREV
jgi:hypothetical protein